MQHDAQHPNLTASDRFAAQQLHGAADPVATGRRGLSRRAALTGFGAAAAGVVISGFVPGQASASGLVPTYALDPTLGGTCIAPGCSVCNACTSHAANKLFATLADAEANRAHPGCRCVGVTGISVTQAMFDELFASAPVTDRRYASVGALLATPIATVTAPGIRGVVPVLATAGGLAALGVVAARSRRTEPS